MRNLVHLFADPKNIWVLEVFMAFMLFVCLFAVVYYMLHRRRGSHFIFNADILQHQKATIQTDLEERYRNLAVELRLVIEALQDLQDRGIRHLENEDKQSFDLKSGQIVLVRTLLPSPEPPEPYLPADALCSIVFYGANGHVVGTRSIQNWDTLTAKEFFDDVRHRIIDEVQLVESRLRAVKEEFPSIWSFWDFFYFSIITQTTVGYGDILPNSTVVRMVVCFQIIIGYGLLVVVLNLVFGHA